MSQRDWGEEPPAPGHWRVTAQPLSKTAPPAPAPAGPQAGPVSSAAPGRTGGRPLLATLICVGVLALALAGQGTTRAEPSDDLAFSVGSVFGGAVFGAILWGIAYAITIRKASAGWKAGSLIVLAVLGGLVALADVVRTGTAPPVTAPPLVRSDK